MDGKPGLGQRWKTYRPAKALCFWSCVASVVATIVIGFAWGGWVTGGTASQMASDAAGKARAQLAAAICVSRFESAPNAVAQLAALKKTDIWQQDDFITKGGWAVLTGMKAPVDGAVDLCAQQLKSATLPVASMAKKTG